MSRRLALAVLLGSGVLVFGFLMFAAGWYAAGRSVAQAQSAVPAAPVQSPAPLQEMIPLPGPNQGPGPGQGQGQGECQPIILFYYQGRLYQLMPGPQNQQGRPTSPPEYFPLQPYQGPQIPGLPFQLPPGGAPQQPQAPGFQPVQPRF